MTKKLYIFSGLGADERVFQKIDFTNLPTTFIKWIIPQDDESIENYATRLSAQIITEKPILIGLSFGGLIAIEIAKQIKTEKIILISSAKTKNEIPFYYRLPGLHSIHKHLSIRILKSSNFITNWFFGVSSGVEKQLLNQILMETNPVFLNWAIGKILNWNNEIHLQNIFHIHGTSDKILPLRFVNCNFTINQGGHLMTLNKSDELNKILKQQLS